MSILREVFSDNPMLVEVRRTWRKAIAPDSWSVAHLVAVILISLVYISAVVLLIRSAEYMAVESLLWALLVFLTLIVPINLHGVLAGEKEKRSLEILLVAPLTTWQITIGKFMRAAVPTVMLMALFILPVALMSVFQALANIGPVPELSPWISLPAGILLCLVSTAMLAAMTLYVSSLCRSTAAAMIATVGALFAVLVLSALMLAPIMAMNSIEPEWIMAWHPFVTMGWLLYGTNDSADVGLRWIVVPAMAGLWLVCTYAFLRATQRVLEREKMQGSTPGVKRA